MSRRIYNLTNDLLCTPPRVFRRSGSSMWYWRQRIAGHDVWRSTGATDKKEAQRIVLTLWVGRQSSTVREVILIPSLPVSSLWDTYTKSEKYANLEKSTQDKKRKNYEMFLAYCKTEHITYAEELTQEKALDFLENSLIKDKNGVPKKRKNKSFNNIKNDFSLIFSMLPEGEKNIFSKIANRSTTRGTRASTPFDYISDAEHDIIISELGKNPLKNSREWLVAAEIAHDTGLRFKDIVLLKFSEIKKDEKGRFLELVPHKTANATGGKKVFIRVQEKLISLLSAQLVKRGQVYVLPELAKKYLRTDGRGGSNLFDRFLKKLGINKSIHCYRVALATKASMAKVDLKKVGGLLGHSSERQTQAYDRSALEIDLDKVLNIKL